MNTVLQLGSGEVTFHLHTGNRENRKWEPDYKFSKPALSDVLLSIGLDNLKVHNVPNCATSCDEMLKYMGLWGSISHSSHHSCYTYLLLNFSSVALGTSYVVSIYFFKYSGTGMITVEGVHSLGGSFCAESVSLIVFTTVIEMEFEK